MIELPIYNAQGQQIDTVKVEESVFGSIVRRKLLKQAVSMYAANKRVGTVKTKGRGMVAGSTRKLYAQKHTGRARAGTLRTCVRRGGGVAFPKFPKDWSLKMPDKARRLARSSAVLSKMLDRQFFIIDQLAVDAPKTKAMTGVLGALKLTKSCLIGTNDYDKNLYLSVRNIPAVSVMPVAEFNAYDVMKNHSVLVTRAAFDRLLGMTQGQSVAAAE
jgi:large subunit ribosomal protein L4